MSITTRQVLLWTAGAAVVGAGVAYAVKVTRKDGSTQDVTDAASVEVSANQLTDSPAPDRIRWSVASGEKWRPLFDSVEQANGIPSGLLYRQAYEESHFRDDIITGARPSSEGALGIMQIVPQYHPTLGADGAKDPQRAVPYAGKFLAQLHRQFGSWQLALAAYNAGPGNVSKYGGIPPFPETQKYVADITGDVPV